MFDGIGFGLLALQLFNHRKGDEEALCPGPPG